jgi:hypothetical protein
MTPEEQARLHDEFRKKRKTFRLLIVGILVLVFVRFFTTPIEEAPAGAGDVIFIGGLLMIAFYSRLVFRCPNCRASLPQTYALPGKKECTCPDCGARLEE